MGVIGQILSGIGGLGSLVCFILVIYQMFKREKTGLAIACIVLILCCVGGLLAFILGWVNNKEWNITTVMLVWTVCIILSIVGSVLNPATFSAFSTIPGRP